GSRRLARLGPPKSEPRSRRRTARSTAPEAPAGALCVSSSRTGGDRPPLREGPAGLRRALRSVTVRVLVNRLPRQVLLGVQAAVRPGDRLGRLVRLETGVQRLLAPLLVLAAEGAVGEHEIVVRRQILGIDAQGLLELGDRFLVPALQEEDAADLVA